MTVSDISPEALARLEAKLLADLEVVRKMRVLVQEHQQTWSAPVTPAAAPAPAPVTPPATPSPPRKTIEEAARECLTVLGGKTFTQEDLRRAIHKASKFYPDAAGVKQFIKRMIREGKVAVEERRTGRIGSLYRCTLPAPAAEENNPGGETPAAS